MCVQTCYATPLVLWKQWWVGPGWPVPTHMAANLSCTPRVAAEEQGQYALENDKCHLHPTPNWVGAEELGDTQRPDAEVGIPARLRSSRIRLEGPKGTESPFPTDSPARGGAAAGEDKLPQKQEWEEAAFPTLRRAEQTGSPAQLQLRNFCLFLLKF